MKKQEIIFCNCGCGKTFKKYDKQWRKRKYIIGHGRKIKDFKKHLLK